MQKDVSSVSGTPGMQVRSIKGLLSEEVTPQSGTASTGISVRTPASTATAIMEEKKISEKESLHIQKSKEYLKLVTTDLEDYLRNLRILEDLLSALSTVMSYVSTNFTDHRFSNMAKFVNIWISDS